MNEMSERSEEERPGVGEEDVDQAHGGQDQSEGGDGEDQAGHAGGGDCCPLLSLILPVGSLSVQWGLPPPSSLLTGGPTISTWMRNKIFHLFKMMETKV